MMGKFIASRMSQSAILPSIDHNIEYSKQKCVALALGHYHAELADPAIQKPNVLQIAKTYGIVESTFRRHIKTPILKTPQEACAGMQVLSMVEEVISAKWLLCLDDFNVPASKITFYELAHQLFHSQQPKRILGRDYIYHFLERNEECRSVFTKMIAACYRK